MKQCSRSRSRQTVDYDKWKSCGGIEMSFPAFNESKVIEYGKLFNCSLVPFLSEFDLLEGPKNDLSEESTDIPIVTYSSSNHYSESRAGLRNIRKMTNARVIFYDLGLNTTQVDEVKSLCNVEYVKLDLSRYPSHVRDLHTYAFKIIVMAEINLRFEKFWLLDASIRITDRTKFHNFHKHVQRGVVPPYSSLSQINHSIYAATNRGMYLYLPISETNRKKSIRNAGLTFIARSTFTTEMIKWQLLCALTKRCIAPSGHKLVCKFGVNRYEDYAGCHRYDQSAVNIIWRSMMEKYGYNSLIERSPNLLDEFLDVKREDMYNGPISQDCST